MGSQPREPTWLRIVGRAYLSTKGSRHQYPVHQLECGVLMMKIIRILSVLITLFVTAPAGAEMLVLVNAYNPVQEVSKRQLVDMYMGRNIHFADGSVALRLDQQPDSADRQQFYKKLVNKSVAQVNAYWARLLFTGRTRPPKTVSSALAVVETIKDNPLAIGYVDASLYTPTDGVKVVGRLD